MPDFSHPLDSTHEQSMIAVSSIRKKVEELRRAINTWTPAPYPGKKRYAIGLALALLTPAQCDTAVVTDKCPEWKEVALQAGWAEDQWPRVDQIIWRESRCQPEVHNKRGRDDSYGLMQLNMKAHKSWVRPMVNNDFTLLFDPLTNLTVGKALYDRAQEQMKCGWKPWVTRKTRGWCK